MGNIMKVVGKILMAIFFAVVIAFTSWMTLLLAQRMIPGNTILQFMTLSLFDVAAFVWFVSFVTQAKGTTQWAVSLIGFGIGIIGSVIMAAGELILGQKLVVLDDPTRLGWILIMVVIVAALAHALLTYAFHFSDPHMRNRIENEQKVAEAIEYAYKDAREQIEKEMDNLTKDLVESVMFDARQQLSQVTAGHIRRAQLAASNKQTVINVPAGASVPDKIFEQEIEKPDIQIEEPEPPSNPTNPAQMKQSRRNSGK